MKKVAVVFVAIAGILASTVFGAVFLLWQIFGGSPASACTPAQPVVLTGTAPTSASLFDAIFQDTKGNSRLTLAMLVGSYLESGWNPKAVGDGSYGAFQIQDPGVLHPDITVAQAMNPAYATNYMLGAYTGALHKVSDGTWTSNPELAAEETAYYAEKPKYHYYQSQGWPKVDKAYTASLRVMQSRGQSTGTSGTSVQPVDTTASQADCAGTVDPTELAVDRAINAAVAKVGADYTWLPPKNGASFVAWAYQQAGLNLPGPVRQLASYNGDSSNGLTTSWLPASGIKSGATPLQSGDIVFWSDGHGKPTRSNVTRAGLFLGSSAPGNALRFASYNVRAASTTAATGPQSGVGRIKRAAALISSDHFAVVGLQELQAPQRAQLLRSLGAGYGIYPARSQYGIHYPGVNSTNSIIWDKSQVSFVSGSSLPMPYYFNGRHMHIPLVRLRQLSSGQQFYALNTHDPAMNPFAHLRYLDARQHAADTTRLAGQGLPVIMTGDFNSAYNEHARINPVWQHKRQNMTWCVMTASGAMLDGYDASRRPVRTGECPERTTRELGVGIVDHIYVSKNVSVRDYHVIESHVTTASDHHVPYIDAQLPGAPIKPTTKGSKYGVYIGADGSKKIAELPVKTAHLAGALRLSLGSDTSSNPTGPAGPWQNPLQMPYVITCPYGYDACGVHAGAVHTGDDLAPYGGSGAPIHAAHGGTIVRKEYDPGGWGNFVVEDVGGGIALLYAHMEAFAPSLSVGQTVPAGQVLGYVGQTGNATGPHLHFTVCTNVSECIKGSSEGTKGTIDPVPFMRNHGVKL